MAKAEAKEVKTNLVLSMRQGDIITAHGVIKFESCTELPSDVAEQLCKDFPELKIVK